MIRAGFTVENPLTHARTIVLESDVETQGMGLTVTGIFLKDRLRRPSVFSWGVWMAKPIGSAHVTVLLTADLGHSAHVQKIPVTVRRVKSEW